MQRELKAKDGKPAKVLRGWRLTALAGREFAGRASRFQDLQVLPGQFAETVQLPVADRLRFHQRAADANGARTRLDELGQRLEIDAARRHQANLWEGAFESLEIAWADSIRRKHFHDVGSGFPGGEDLRRGERAGHHQLVVPVAQPDHVRIERRRNDELCPGKQSGPCRLGVEDRAGSQEARGSPGPS